MTIKDIAELAGVSVSTVSKIINGKDQNIKKQTRERVLDIVKRYNYTPYAFIKNMERGRSFLLGLILDAGDADGAFTNRFIKTANTHGYQVALCRNETPEDELKHIASLCKNGVDGVAWRPFSDDSRAHEAHFRKNRIVCATLPAPGEDGGIDYADAGFTAAQLLVEQKHTGIGYIGDESRYSELYLQGIRRYLFESNIPFREDEQVYPMQANLFGWIQQAKLTALICASEAAALRIYDMARIQHCQIPEELSIVCITGKNAGETLYPGVTNLAVPYGAYGQYIAEKLIAQIEATGEPACAFVCEPLRRDGNSVAPPKSPDKNILVVGSINIDVMVQVTSPPQMGAVITAEHCVSLPGGKGMNQSVAVAKLGASSALIGKVGRDYDSIQVYDCLHEHGVNTRGVSADRKRDTGKAYIYVQRDGESSIVIYPGANYLLTTHDIEAQKELFGNARFCLLQTEIPMDAVCFAAELAKAEGALTMLKPSMAEALPDELYRKIDYFMPNAQEASLLSGEAEPEKQAAFFLKKGVGAVVITLGHVGCYWRSSGSDGRYFPAYEFKAVDTTGGADAFIAAFAVKLADGETAERAIEYAMCAAGFAVSRQGTVPAMIDKTTLELYMRNA
ncbi:MAG: PfkB family carbohydrate kinase [Clostridiales Family XIII bacterium]|jgi:ribokinase|nr:PfkB family carbohydrate kinase [Clostridiales Family XIII bacterium]